ncbi:hypothetical protein YC2023_083475 [Brassica napus]
MPLKRTFNRDNNNTMLTNAFVGQADSCQLLVRGRRERCPKPLVNYWGMVLIPIGGESFDLSGFVIRDGGSLDGFSPARSLWFRRRECEKLCCV